MRFVFVVRRCVGQRRRKLKEKRFLLVTVVPLSAHPCSSSTRHGVLPSHRHRNRRGTVKIRQGIDEILTAVRLFVVTIRRTFLSMFATQIEPIEQSNDDFDPGKNATVDERFELILIVKIVGRAAGRLVVRFVRHVRRNVENVTSPTRAKRGAMRIFPSAFFESERGFARFRTASTIQFRFDVFHRFRFLVVLVDQHRGVMTARRFVVSLLNRRVRRS